VFYRFPQRFAYFLIAGRIRSMYGFGYCGFWFGFRFGA